MNNFYTRKNTGLKGFDYPQMESYFLTMCSENRACIFNLIKDIDNPVIELTENGVIMIISKLISLLLCLIIFI